MECIDLHLADTIFSFFWILVSFWWALLVFIANKKHSVVLHLTLNGFLLVKVLPAVNLFLCMLREKHFFFKVFAAICEVLIETVYFVSSLGMLYFCCLGLGFLKVEQTVTRFKLVFLLFLFSYVTASLLHFYREFGDFLAFLYYQVTYICLLDTFFQATSMIRDSENTKKRKQVKILNSCKNLIFLECYLKSMFHLVMFFNSYFEWSLGSPEVFLNSFDLLVLTRLLYTVRPREKAGFCCDFLFPQDTAVEIGLFEACLAPRSSPVAGGGCLVLLPCSSEEVLKFGCSLG